MRDALYAPLRDWLARKTGNPVLADDIAAGAFVGLWRYLERGSRPLDPRGFLSVAASGLLKNHWRDEGLREEDAAGLLPELDYLSTWSAPTWEGQTFTTSFDSALRAMPEQERSAFILTELRGLPLREAAAHLGTYPMAALRRSEAARTFIRKELAA